MKQYENTSIILSNSARYYMYDDMPVILNMVQLPKCNAWVMHGTVSVLFLFFFFSVHCGQ